MQFDFTGKAVIMTGAARGIGRSMVKTFHDAGAMVLAADRDAEGLAETCEPFEERVASIVGDVSTLEGANAIVDRCVEEFGRLDVCVNNAAVAPITALLEETAEVWDTVYSVNCRGIFLMTQAAGRTMIDLGTENGRIINFSSGSAKSAGAGAGAYASSRAAVESFTRVAAIELAPHDILVNSVSPGLIDTQPKPLPPRMEEGLGKRIPTLPLARAGEPEEVAWVTMFLASEYSSYVCGAVWEVDGAAGIGTRAGHKIIDDDPRYDWVTGNETEG